MQLSIIIPTRNRQDQLKQALTCIFNLNEKVDFEVIVIDNNSTDKTKETVKSFHQKVRYYFEANTSFTKARNIAPLYAKAEILLYIDDDVLIKSGSLERIVDIFNQYQDCGVVAGKILPKYIEKPPFWALKCQKVFNGWSLYKNDDITGSNPGIQEVSWAAGPLLAVRKDILIKVKGFPPDTVGVETDKSEISFRKLYIGPGDYGLCHKIQKIGYKILYSPGVSCSHVIPPLRYSVEFWRSRIIGEAQHKAISNLGLFRLNPLQRLLLKVNYLIKYKINENKFLKMKDGFGRTGKSTVSVGELWLHYYQAYLDIDRVLDRFPGLWKLLWNIGSEGVDDKNYIQVKKALPQEYLDLVSQDYMYNSSLITDKRSYYLFKNRLKRQ